MRSPSAASSEMDDRMSDSVDTSGLGVDFLRKQQATCAFYRTRKRPMRPERCTYLYQRHVHRICAPNWKVIMEMHSNATTEETGVEP